MSARMASLPAVVAAPSEVRNSPASANPWAGAALIAVAVGIAYFPALRGGFIWDDNSLITNNKLVQADDGLYRLWFTTDPIDYWPLTNTSFWFEWRLWGANSTGYHVTNLVLHVASALLVWAILRKLAVPGAFLAGLLFAVHPVNVESVAWIAQRKNSLAMLFFLLSILSYLRADERSPATQSSEKVWYWLSLAAFVLAMLSKGSVAILPLTLLAIAWWRRRHIAMGDLLRTAPFFLAAAVLTAVNIWFQTHGGQAIRSVTFAQRLSGAGGVTWFYLAKAFLPINLAFVYPQWHILPQRPVWWLPIVAAIGLTLVLIWHANSAGSTWRRALLFAWATFCIGLLPVLGLTDVYFMKFSLVADHYEHIALISAVSLIAAGWWHWRQSATGAMRQAILLLAVAVVGACALSTWNQSRLYASAITLYQSTLEKNPDCWMAHNNLGVELASSGRPDAALPHYRQALNLKPAYSEAYYNLGSALVDLHRLPEAIASFEAALRINANYPEAQYNLANALYAAGQTQPAVEHFQTAIELKSNFSAAHYNLAKALEKLGLLSDAIRHYQQAALLRPDFAEGHFSYGNALVQTGRLKEAIDQFHSALRLKPDAADVHFNLAIALVQDGRPQLAVEHFQQVLRHDPRDAAAQFNLATTYALLQDDAAAISAGKLALELARSQGQTALAQEIESWLNGLQRNRQ